jgi:hypothetical protein
MSTETTVVECGRCGRPFAVKVRPNSDPITGYVTVPAHRRLGSHGEPEDAICDGDNVSAIPKGPYPAWRKRWVQTHNARVAPNLLDGFAVRVHDP